VLLFIGNGINDTIMKYTEHHFIENSNELTLFLALIFLTSLIMGSIISTARFIQNKHLINFKTIIAGTILGLLNFGSTFYILKSMGVYESAVVFPVANAGIVSLSALTGYILFREKLSRMNWAGILLAILAILLIANA
jgi:drug/metabolite transporter (DMT)-like permease